MSFVAVYLYLDSPVLFLGPDASWLTVGHLLLPFCFFSVHLTNRRYGPSTAFAQVVLALAVCVAFVMFAAPRLTDYVPFKIVPELRVALAFAGAFLGASFLSIIVFDGARGPRWWLAPLLGMVSSVAVLRADLLPRGLCRRGLLHPSDAPAHGAAHRHRRVEPDPVLVAAPRRAPVAGVRGILISRSPEISAEWDRTICRRAGTHRPADSSGA